MTADNSADPRVNKLIPWLVVLPFLAITVVMVMGQGHFKHAEPITGSFDLGAAVKTVKIVTDVGNVDVVMGPPGRIRFEGRTLRATGSQAELARATAVPFTLESAPSDDPSVFVVRVSAMPVGFLRLPPRPGDDQDQVSPRLLRQMDVRLQVPVDLGVDLQASQGSIRVDTRQASTSVQVDKGMLMLQHITGALTARNGEGDTMIDQHRGALTLQANGKTRIDMAEVNGRIEVVNDKGELDFVLPPHSAAAIEARSLTGRVRNGFGFDLASENGGTVTLGKLNQGTHPVRLIARQGTLTVKATGPR